nr:MFS transporter [Nocardia anaemiae]
MLGNFITATPANLNGRFQAQFHLAGDQLTWISNVSLMAIALFELTFGVLGDMFGRKWLLLVGSVLALAGQGLSAAAPDVYALWIGQALAGSGAAAFLACSLALMTRAPVATTTEYIEHAAGHDSRVGPGPGAPDGMAERSDGDRVDRATTSLRLS